MSTGSTYNFTHSGKDEGSHIIEAQIFDQTGTKLLDSRTWTACQCN